MAIILNLIIVILEIIAFFKGRKGFHIRQSFLYYTLLSNLITLISSLLLVIFGPKDFVVVLRFLSVCMLIMTFFVTTFILVPVTKNPKGLLFSGSGLFHHLIIPVLSSVSYLVFEKRANIRWVWLPAAVTLAYGLIMLYLNYKKKVDGPYPFFMIERMGAKKVTIWMVCLMLMMSGISLVAGYQKPLQTNLRFVFVHGLAGWGSYDRQNDFIPYWGMTGGDVINDLNKEGYQSYAASVDPKGSAWDRACELYAQLTGTRVDYGKVHSEKAGHDRFGEDFSRKPLMTDFQDSDFVLIGHSFGGATVRLFSEILRNGSEEEVCGTDPNELSDFFKGGSGDGLFAVITLAAPTNGTTAYDLYEDPSFDLSQIPIPEDYEEKSNLMSGVSTPVYDGRELYDYAAFDMHIDNALAMNKRIETFGDVYYFAYPCASTRLNAEGTQDPDPAITEGMFLKSATYMGRYTGTTAGGFVVDESWQQNDGLVNTVSAGAPLGQPRTDYLEGQEILPGVWNVMPVITGDHMSLQGGLSIRVPVKPFYLNLVEMLSRLAS